MAFYWIFFGILCWFTIRTPQWSIKRQNLLLNIIALTIAIFVGCRIDVGADWSGYVEEYKVSVNFKYYFREPIFFYIAKFMSSIGFPYPWFFLLLSYVQMHVLIKAANLFRIKMLFIFFLLFYAIFFCMTTLNVIRHGLMISFIWLALGYLKDGYKLKAIICIFVGAGFHFMAFVLLPLIFILTKRLNKKTVYITILCGFLFLLLNISQKIFEFFPYIALLETKMTSYLNDDFLSEETNFSLGQLFDLCLCLYVFIKFNRWYDDDKRLRILVNSLLFAFMVNCSLYAYGIFTERIAQVFKFSLIFLIPIIYEKYAHCSKNSISTTLNYIKGKKNHTLVRQIFLLCIIFYSALYMHKAIETPDPSHKKIYEFKPYKFSLTNYFEDVK